MEALSEQAQALIEVQGQFFPFFILTISGLITLPLTYNLLKPSTGDPPF